MVISVKEKALEIFKPGTFVAENGQTYSFSDADVQASVNAYDPAVFKAPLVVGHPKLDSPAFGWVDSLAFSSAKKVLAAPTDVDPAFAEAVNKKRFPKISASFFHPDSPSNPVPGVFYLRHVGFLGGAAPAVKGLEMASFAECAESDIVTIDFSNPEEKPVNKATDNKDDKTNVDFAERENKLTAKEQALADREKALAKKEQDARVEGIASFAEVLVAEGKVLPAEKEGLVAFMAGLNERDTVSFANGDEKVEKTADKWLRDFLSALPARVDFAEHGANTDEEQTAHASFAAPSGYTVDKDRLALHNKVLAYQTKHKCDYTTALNAVV